MKVNLHAKADYDSAALEHAGAGDSGCPAGVRASVDRTEAWLVLAAFDSRLAGQK